MKKNFLKKFCLTLPVIPLSLTGVVSCTTKNENVIEPSFSVVQKSRDYIVNNDEAIRFVIRCDTKNLFTKIDCCSIISEKKISITSQKTNITIDDQGLFSLTIQFDDSVDHTQDIRFKFLFSYTVDGEETFSILDDSDLSFLYDIPNIQVLSHDEYCYKPQQALNYKFKFNNVCVPNKVSISSIYSDNIEAVGLTQNIPVDPLTQTFDVCFQFKERPEDKIITCSINVDVDCDYGDCHVPTSMTAPLTYRQEECKIIRQSNDYLLDNNTESINCKILAFDDVFPEQINEVVLNTTSECLSLEYDKNIPVDYYGNFTINLLVTDGPQEQIPIEKIYYSLMVTYEVGGLTYTVSSNQMRITRIVDTKQSTDELYFILSDDGVLSLTGVDEAYVHDYLYKKNDEIWTPFSTSTLNYNAGDIISIKTNLSTWSSSHDHPMGLYFTTPVYVGGCIYKAITINESDNEGSLPSECFPKMFGDSKNNLWSDIIGVNENLFQGIESVGQYSLYGLFWQCRNLTFAPILPNFSHIDNNGLTQLFYNCKKLHKIKTLSTQPFFGDNTYQWVFNVSPSGDFYYNGEYQPEDFGVSGIPEHWNVIQY